MRDPGNHDTWERSAPLWGVHVLMLLASVLVASSFTVGAAITHGLPPEILTLVRFLLATFFFTPLVVWRYGLVLPGGRQLAGYCAISACIVGFFWCMFEALRYTSALNTSVIFTLVPGISGIYSAVWLGERLGRQRLLALILGVPGALWVIFRGDLERLFALDINRGDLLFLAGCFLMAAYPPMVKRLHRNESMVVMTYWVLVTGVGWLLLLAAPGLAAVEWWKVEPRVWAGILYLAIFTTIVTFYVTQLAIPHLGPTRVTAYSYFYPAFVLLFDWGLGHGLPKPVILPGVMVVLLASVVLQSGAGTIDSGRLARHSRLPAKAGEEDF